MSHQSAEAPAADTDVPPQRRRRGSVSNLEHGDGTPAGCRPIAGMKRGWYYRSADRMILHRQTAEDAPLAIGQVPQVVSTITHLTDDGEDIRTEYLAKGKRQRRPRILTEDELDRGTWAAKLGARRPTGNDEKHAFARLIREEGDKAPIVPARTYYNEAGDLIFPEADAQTLGYRVLRGEEKDAREAWEEIGAWACDCGKSALSMGYMFAGPIFNALDVLGHMLNAYGDGQQGKSTILTVACAAFGDIKPKRQKILIGWDASKQGVGQSLRVRGFLPVGLDEQSSSGRPIKETSRDVSQWVAGAQRSVGTADGSPKESDGFFHSAMFSTSNESLKFAGQTEDLASRLHEVQTPFFPNKFVDADGAPAAPGSGGAEHISKRLKRLSFGFGGWPLEWAIRKGMYRAENLAKLKRFHLELCAKYRPAEGGIAGTIAEMHMAWVVGAHMLGQAIGVPTLGEVAEREAAARLQAAIQVAAENNVPDHEKLWEALDALRIEKSAFPEKDKLPSVAEDGFRRLRGFTDPETGQWWVVNPVVQEAAAQAGIDNVSAALRKLHDLHVHIRDAGRNVQKKLPKEIRGAGLGERMHCFNVRRAGELFAPDEEPDSGSGSEFPAGATPQGYTETPLVAPENEPLTCDGATGATGATPSLFDFTCAGENNPGTTAPVGTPGAAVPTVVPPTPTDAPAVAYPPARLFQSGDTRLDDAWLNLEFKAKGRTRSALDFGVLGNGELYLPNHEPVTVPLPGNVDQVPDLMHAYGLKTLWVHESAALAMGLPSCDERRGLPVVGKDQEDDEEDQEEGQRPGSVGPQTPVAHPWAVPSGAGAVREVAPGGLASWLTLICGEAEGERRLNVALPLYDTRIKKNQKVGGFGGPETPEVLLDALMVWTLSTQHGPEDQPRVIPFYASVNRTAQDFAGGRKREDVWCEAVRRREVEPVLHNRVPLMVPQQWGRQLTDEERGRAVLHRFDKSAAWLGAFSNVELGTGEPVHAAAGAAFDAKVPGFWRVADIPGKGPAGLPELRFREAEQGGYWISTPSLVLLLDKTMYPDWTPDVVEAWYWPEHKRALNSMYTKVFNSRKYIASAAEAGRPGAPWAKQINGRTYQSFRGYMARTAGPMTDHATGDDYKQDIYYRPDWARLIMDHATANMYRNLVKFAADGCFALAVCVDAVTWASNEVDPIAARPQAMVHRLEGGTGTATWTHEGSAPLAELLPALEAAPAGRTAHHVLDDYLTRGE